MRKLVFFALFFLIICAGISCKRVKPEAPAASTLDTLLQPDISVFYVPVQYRVSGFQDFINEKIQGKFISKWINLNDKGDSLHLEVLKTREITLRRKDRTLFIVVPLKISGLVRAKMAGIKMKNQSPVEAEVNLHLSTTLSFDNRWNLISDSKIEKIDWVKEPKLKIAFVKVNLKGTIENMLEKKESQITSKADAAVKQLLNTHKVVADIWRDIQKPIRINNKGVQVWLKFHGVDLNGRLEETDPDLISMLFELKAYTRIYFEGDSIPISNVVVPTFSRIDYIGDSLLVNVHSLISFNMVNEFLNRELIDKPITAKGYSTKIRKVNVYGTQKGIAIELAVKGDINGTVYVTGTPSIDSTTNILSLHDFDFDLNSESSLLSSADWLLHSTVLDMLSDKLKIDLNPLAAKLPTIIFSAIEKGKTGQKIDLNVDTLAIYPKLILPTKNNLQLLVLARGKASVVLDQRLFNKNDKKVKVR
ncbi:MAG: DUF4403 family protein [Bacteroidetes bacterium]|nr:DUF4403 family protein [Bacteroidota bacterium]MBL0031115.1 DUF4403 family protein [Bacteroidota bacterium]MBP6531671.1 DUF4403 family protein [Bacteroidia bacterium]MBP6656220.1 DUF4403 family protein [Bacteroidia bacterium]